MKLKFSIPWPPSVNKYWLLKPNGSRYLSPAAKDFRDQVGWIVAANKDLQGAFMSGAVCVGIVQHPPDGRIRDIDNVLKAVLDALTHAGVWSDDQQVSYLSVRRGKRVEGGRLDLSIWRPFESEGGVQGLKCL